MDLLINMTVTFSVTVILILILKAVFKNRFTPKWHVLIWTVLIIRLAIPILPESEISIFNYIPDMSDKYVHFIDQKTEGLNNVTEESIRNPQDNEIMDEHVVFKTDDSNQGNSISETTKQNQYLTKNMNLIKYIEKMILAIYWLGILIMTLGLSLSYGWLLKKIRKLPICSDNEILKVFSICKEGVGVRNHKLTLKQGGESPMLAGVFNPVIYISEGYSREELKHVFNHELCHYKNKDNIWNMVSSALLCMNWFNPLAWYAFKIFRRDLEMYCDYMVIGIAGEKKAYAEVLLKTASAENSFMFATTCLESGEKEVSQRIKKIAYFKKPKVWVSIAGLLLVLLLAVCCLTNAVDLSKRTQVIGVSGPDNEWDNYMMEVPLSWGKDYEEVMPEGPPYCENILFKDKDGNEIAGLNYRTVDLSECEFIPQGSNAITMTGRVNYESKVKELIKQSKSFSELADNKESNVKIERLKSNSTYIWDAYKVNYLRNSKVLRTEIYIAADEYSRTLPVLYKESNNITQEELIKAAMTLEEIKDPAIYKPKAEAGMLTNAKTGTGVMGGDYDARILMEDYLNNYVNIQMPPSRDIKGYKINSFKEIGPMGDVPGIIDEGMAPGENAPWNIIYPTAKVYKVDYELIPEVPSKYGDVAGGSFEITKKGNKHYDESYAVFYSYSEDGKTYKAAFLGFLIDGNLAEWGVDYSVLNLINYWYEHEVLDRVYENAAVQYVGDASAVGKLVRLLPLHEYSNGMELQTKAEPYGITVNYKIGRSEPYNSEKGGLLSAWPEVDGDLSGIYSHSSPNELNFYIKKQLEKNAEYLTSEIENSESTTIKCESPYLEKKFNFDYSDLFSKQ
nr:M56 family metallopeptidase [uncultured Aminipila sp.]